MSGIKRQKPQLPNKVMILRIANLIFKALRHVTEAPAFFLKTCQKCSSSGMQ